MMAKTFVRPTICFFPFLAVINAAAKTYSLVQTNFNDTGIPTPEGMNNIIKMIQSQIKPSAKTMSFQDVAEPRFAVEVARDLGYKID